MRRRIAIAALAVLALGGCSIISFVYDHADRFALSYIDGWFDLDSAQGKRFRERFRERMVLHRKDELPRYSAFLRELRAKVAGAPTAAELDAMFRGSREIIELGIRRTLPLMADTLAELSPEQVEHLAREMAENNEEFVEEMAEDTPAERKREREEDLIDEMEDWTGRLAEPQRARLRALVAAVPDGRQPWFEHRQQRQRGLLALLRARAPRDAYVAYAEEWWLGDRHLDPAIAQQLERNRRLSAECFAGLIASLTPKQRTRALDRIDDLIGELDELHAKPTKR
jgi:hypothetical protein